MSFWKKMFGGASLSKMTFLEQAAKDGDRDRVQGLLRISNDPSIIQKAIKLANKGKWHAVVKDLQEALDILTAKGQQASVPTPPASKKSAEPAGSGISQIIDEIISKKWAGAFWENDKPSGIGVLFEIEEMRLDALHAVYDVQWDREADKSVLVDKLMAQLKKWAATKDKDDAIGIYGTIYLLEKHGYIKSDEFNGISIKSMTLLPSKNML
jgi:hypothetical protein